MATTTIDTARAAIEARIAAQWADTRIRWPGQHYTPPDDKSWLAVDIVWGDGIMLTKNGRNSLVGVLYLNIYVPVGTTGGRVLAELCDDARDMINRWSGSGVVFEAPSGPRLSVMADSKWRQATITAAFTIEEEV